MFNFLKEHDFTVDFRYAPLCYLFPTSTDNVLAKNKLNKNVIRTLLFPNNKYGLFCFNKNYLCLMYLNIEKDLRNKIGVSVNILICKVPKDNYYGFKLEYHDDVSVYHKYFDDLIQIKNNVKEINSAYTYARTKINQFALVKDNYSYIQKIASERTDFIDI